jgi:hypothetical protein
METVGTIAVVLIIIGILYMVLKSHGPTDSQQKIAEETKKEVAEAKQTRDVQVKEAEQAAAKDTEELNRIKAIQDERERLQQLANFGNRRKT